MKPGDLVTCKRGEELLHNELPHGGFYVMSSRSGTLDDITLAVVVAKTKPLEGDSQIYVVSHKGAGWIEELWVKKVPQ